MSESVFINVPFDAQYQPFFDAIVFTVLACDYVPQCTLNIFNTAKTRHEKNLELVGKCQMSIHDLSRSMEKGSSRSPRLNMPFELGVFLGARAFGGDYHKNKTCIVLDSDPGRYHKYISDLGGHDLSSHKNSIPDLIKLLRKYLTSASDKDKNDIPPGAKLLHKLYDEFKTYRLPEICQYYGLDPENLDYGDYVGLTHKWLDISGFKQPDK